MFSGRLIIIFPQCAKHYTFYNKAFTPRPSIHSHKKHDASQTISRREINVLFSYKTILIKRFKAHVMRCLKAINYSGAICCV